MLRLKFRPSLDNDDLETIWHHARARVWDVCGCGRRRPKLCRYKENPSRRNVERHRARTFFRLHRLEYGKAKLARIHNGERSISSIRRECQSMLRIKASGIGRVADCSQG